VISNLNNNNCIVTSQSCTIAELDNAWKENALSTTVLQQNIQRMIFNRNGG